MCSYIDALATDSYVMINKKLAKMTNFQTAAYWAILLNILRQVKAKNTYDPQTGFFSLKRSYIEEELGLPTEEQKNCDVILAKLGVLAVDPGSKNKVALNVKRMEELLVDDTLVPQEVLAKTVKLSYADKQAAKVAGIQSGIVEIFGETDDRAIAAVQKLVDVYYSKGYVKRAQWEPIVKTLHACTGGDPEALVEITEFIVASNWQNINSAIDVFMQKHAGNATKLKTTQKKCAGTADNIAF